MNRWVKASMAVMVVAASVLASQVSGVSPALAVSCSGGYSAPFWSWTRSDEAVYGVRAPVELRRDGSLCGTNSDKPFAAAWIAIQNQAATSIAQIGFIHHYNSSNENRWCRFWAIDGGIPNFYDCSTSNGTYVYFRIKQLSTYYNIEDCGTAGGYSNCTLKNDSQHAYTQPEGVVAAETDYSCVIRIMGSASAPVHYGSSANPVEGYVSSWGTRTWSRQTEGDCTSDYEGKQVTGGMVTWDSRN